MQQSMQHREEPPENFRAHKLPVPKMDSGDTNYCISNDLVSPISVNWYEPRIADTGVESYLGCVDYAPSDIMESHFSYALIDSHCSYNGILDGEHPDGITINAEDLLNETFNPWGTASVPT